MQTRHPAAEGAAAAAIGADLLRIRAGFDAAVLDFAVDRWRRNLDVFMRLATCGSPLAFTLLWMDAAAEATAEGLAIAQRLCGMVEPAVADSALVVS